MKRVASTLSLPLLLLALAACQTPAPTFDYAGVSIMNGVEYDLILSFERLGDRLTGEYSVDAARGTFHATATEVLVAGELRPSPSCTYELEGVLTESAFTATFEPTACPGGQSGSWTLERQ